MFIFVNHNFFIFTNEDGKSGVLNIYTGIDMENMQIEISNPRYIQLMIAKSNKANNIKDEITDISFNAGNKSGESEYAIKVDTTTPKLSDLEFKLDGDTNYSSASGVILSNKTKNILINITRVEFISFSWQKTILIL